MSGLILKYAGWKVPRLVGYEIIKFAGRGIFRRDYTLCHKGGFEPGKWFRASSIPRDAMLLKVYGGEI